MSRVVRWGILGAGRVAREFARGLRALPDAELAAVASRTAGTAETFARELGPVRVYPDYEALVRDPSLDVVYVATPNHRHVADAELCLTHGKPVLCEKPFALDAAGAREIVRAARAAGLFCMEAMWMRCIPLVQRVRALVADGAIGEVQLLVADFGVPTPFDPRSRFFDPAQGGGALLDRGVYLVSLASMLLGAPTLVTSQAVIGPTGVDEQLATVLGYAGGRQAVLTASLRGASSNEAMIVGSGGMIRVEAPVYCPRRVTISAVAESCAGTDGSAGWRQRLRARARRSPLARRLYARVRPLLDGRRTIVQEIRGNGYNYEAAEVMRCLRAGALESAVMPLDETIRIMETLDEIRARWQDGGGVMAGAARSVVVPPAAG